MSMRNYGVSDYGIILPAAAQVYMAHQVDPHITANDPDDSDVVDAVYDYSENIDEFYGEAFGVMDNGYTDYYTYDTYDGDRITYLGIKSPSLFEAAYEDMSDFVAQAKAEYGDMLPPNFDYRANIRHIIGSYYG